MNRKENLSSDTEREKQFEELKNEGTVEDLLQELRMLFPDLQPDSESGFVNLLLRRELLIIGTRLPEGVRIGMSYGFWPEKHSVNLTHQVPSGSIGIPLDRNQHVRWEIRNG